MMSSENEFDSDSFVSGYLLYLLAATSEAASAQFHAQIRAQGLRVPEWRVLACLVDSDGMMVTHLARLALLEQSRVTKIITQMDARGLVERVGDAGDKRRVKVRLTDNGHRLALDLVDQAKAHEAHILSALADTDAARIKRTLQTVLTVLADGP